MVFDVFGCVYPKNKEYSKCFSAKRYSATHCVEDKSIATCANVICLLLPFEKLKLSNAPTGSVIKRIFPIISKTFLVFRLVKTSGYQLKVFAFKLSKSHSCQTTIVEKH